MKYQHYVDIHHHRFYEFVGIPNVMLFISKKTFDAPSNAGVQFETIDSRFQTSFPVPTFFSTNYYVQNFPYDRKKYINAYPLPPILALW